jgi:hypothetical protein
VIGGDERGGATIVALLVMILIAALGAALVVITTTETLIGASYRSAQEAAHGADAAVDRTIHDLAVLADWSVVLAVPPANVRSTFDDGAGAPRGPDGRQLDLLALTAARQRDSDVRAGAAIFGADSPQWRLYAHAPIEELLPSARIVLPVYLVVWVADDGLDGDGDPARDANGAIAVHAEAFGTNGTRSGVQASIHRLGNGIASVTAWHRVP